MDLSTIWVVGAIAIFGIMASIAFALSILSIAMHNTRMAVQVKVLPHLVDLGLVDGRHGQHTIGVEITNMSEFPITIKDVMFKGRNFSIVLQPNNFLKGSIPMRLAPRGNAVLILTKEIAKQMSDLSTAKVTVRTACKNEVSVAFAMKTDAEQEEIDVLSGREKLKKKGWFSWLGKNKLEFDPQEPEPEPVEIEEDVEEFEEEDVEEFEEDEDDFDIDLSDEFEDEDEEDEEEDDDEFEVEVDDAVSRRVKGM